MGGSVTKGMKETMEKSFKDQQDFMLSSQKMQMGRQIHMQLQMREKMMAQQLAMARERTYWYSGFYVLAVTGTIAGYMRSRRQWMLTPILPLTFIVGYQLDMAFGNKMDRIIAEADSILKNESNLVAIPGGAPSIESIDAARNKKK